MVALGALLHDLLAGRDQPGALRLLVVQAGASAPTITLTELVYQLGQWERPNRKELLNAVYAMLRQRPGSTRPVVAAPPVAGVSPAEKEIAAQRAASRSGRRVSPRVLAGAAIGGGLIVVAAVLLFASRGGASGSAPALSSEALPYVGAESVPAPGSAALDRTVGSRSSGPQGREPAVAPRAFADNRLALPERAIVSPRPSGPATPPSNGSDDER